MSSYQALRTTYLDISELLSLTQTVSLSSSSSSAEGVEASEVKNTSLDWVSLRRDMIALSIDEPTDYRFDKLDGYMFSLLRSLGFDRLSKSAGFRAENVMKNRYSDIVPYDYNRVTASVPEWYVNASHITLGNRRYIASQAPKTIKHSCEDSFFYLIESQKIQTIVNLTMHQEHSKEKCALYWKTGFIMRPKGVDGAPCEWFVKRECGEELLAVDKIDETQRLVRRTFIIKFYDEAVAPRQFTQIHYENWPDNGAPSLSLFRKLLEIINEINDPSPTLVHCSAGVGRTGTFISGMHIFEMLKAKELGTDDVPRKVFHSVKELRMQRADMVVSHDQFESIVSLGKGVLEGSI